LSSLLAKAHRDGKRYLNPVPTTVGGGSLMLKVAVAYFKNKEERTPVRPLGPFETDSRIYQEPSATGLRLTWFGHSTALIEIDGVRILIDPIWEQRASPVEWAGPKRFFQPPLRLEDLPPLDVILLSHDHYDHLGSHTIRRLAQIPAQASAAWVAPRGVGIILQRRGVNRNNIHELDWTDSFKLRNLKITALPARHFSGRSVFNRFHTLWASFVFDGSQHRIFFGGDSGEWPGVKEIGQQYGPFDLSMLEIGAFDPLWSDIHSGPDGAVRNFQALGATGLLMPVHWGLFDLALHAWRQPIQRVSEITGLPLWSPKPGVPTELERGIELRSDWWR
jgi:L-ascorbate metabolism protein UlaG (beta-lactamase superfamily)